VGVVTISLFSVYVLFLSFSILPSLLQRIHTNMRAVPRLHCTGRKGRPEWVFRSVMKTPLNSLRNDSFRIKFTLVIIWQPVWTRSCTKLIQISCKGHLKVFIPPKEISGHGKGRVKSIPKADRGISKSVSQIVLKMSGFAQSGQVGYLPPWAKLRVTSELSFDWELINCPPKIQTQAEFSELMSEHSVVFLSFCPRL